MATCAYHDGRPVVDCPACGARGIARCSCFAQVRCAAHAPRLLRIAGRLVKVEPSSEFPGDWRIYWMADWTAIWHLAEHNLVMMRSYGATTYHHVDFFVGSPFTSRYVVDLGPGSGMVDKRLAEA